MMFYLEYILMTFFIIIFLGFVYLYLLSLFNFVIYGVPQVCTFNSDFKVLTSFFKKTKDIKLNGKKLIDLGSGTGKITRFFEKEFKMQTTGYEIDLSNYLISIFLKKIFGSKAKLVKGNYFDTDLTEFDFIYVYLLPKLMKDIETKIWGGSKKGTIIISNAFKFEKYKPFKILYGKNNKEEVFLYKI